MGISRHSLFLLFWATLANVGCSPNASIKEIAQYSYGDEEDEFIGVAGVGSEIIYFKIDNSQYHYRIYKHGSYKSDTGGYASGIYGFMFKDEKLSAIVQDEDDGVFTECIKLSSDSQWEDCFTYALQELENRKYKSPSSDFSDAIEAEENTDALSTFSFVLLGATHIVLWPIAIISDPVNINKNVQAHNCVEHLLAKINSIYLHETDSSAITIFDQIHPELITSSQDQILGNRRLVQKTWHCDSTSEFGFYEIEILAGFVNDQSSWIDIQLRPECCFKWELDPSYKTNL